MRLYYSVESDLKTISEMNEWSPDRPVDWSAQSTLLHSEVNELPGAFTESTLILQTN